MLKSTVVPYVCSEVASAKSNKTTSTTQSRKRLANNEAISTSDFNEKIAKHNNATIQSPIISSSTS